jgi:hypothetical protein
MAIISYKLLALFMLRKVGWVGARTHNQRLKSARKIYPVIPPMVEYSLTQVGQLFIKPLEMLKAWGEENSDVLKNLSRRRNNTVSPRKAK